MDMIYERNLQHMKLAILKGMRQDQAVLNLAKRLGINRQLMRKILIDSCDMIILENLGSRLEAADAIAADDSVSDALSLPHLTMATGLLSESAAAEFHRHANSGTPVSEILAEILEAIA
jgi:energy-converting hydrogenase A subunit M